MKKIENDFLKDFNNSLQMNKSFDDIHNRIDIKSLPKENRGFFVHSYKKIGIVFALIMAFIIPVTIVIINSKGVDTKFDIKFRKELAKVVYNTAIKDDETYIPYEINKDNLDFSLSGHKWKYTDLKVNSSFVFTINMNTSLTPYFSVDLIGKDVDIIIANIELNYQQKYLNGWFEEDMMIIKYNKEIIGFMSPGLYDYNEEKIDDYTDLYAFGSYMFLTENYKVKYYEETDWLYNFYINAKDKENIIFSSKTSYLGDVIDNGSVAMTEGSYDELSGDITLSLIEDSMVKEIKTRGVVTHINNEKIYVESEETPSLESITLFSISKIYINNVLIIELKDEKTIEIGDVIEFSYYQRYSTYIPVDIYVESINIIR